MMVYTPVLNRGGKGVESPVDNLWRKNSGVFYRNHITVVRPLNQA
jgi:hypothetical protein